MGIGYTELILIFLVVLLFFGASRLPGLARSMGKACNEFKKAKDGLLDDEEEKSGKTSEDKTEEEKKSVSSDQKL